MVRCQSVKATARSVLGVVACMVAAFGSHPASATKRIALTIDDVPSAVGPFMSTDDRRVRMIAALKAARVRQAAIFVNPGRLVRPDDPGSVVSVLAYAAAGHVLANHSFTHPRLSVTSADAYMADVASADRWLRARRNFRPWFRFPYLDEAGSDAVKRDAVRHGLATLGLRNAPPTVDGWDWNLERMAAVATSAGKTVDRAALGRLFVEAHVVSADAVDKLARRLLGRSPVEVMLLHETDVTALYLVDMVAALRADGWQIVTADRTMRDPLYRHVPAGPPAGGLLIDAIAGERGVDGFAGQRYDDLDYQQRRFDKDVVGALTSGAPAAAGDMLSRPAGASTAP
jgi:peptidoglycan-N-acetylglucosamine deacetylase